MGLTDIQINAFVNMKKDDLKHLLMEEIPDDYPRMNAKYYMVLSD